MKHTYTLDGSKILREVWGSNVLIPMYHNEDSVCGVIYNDVLFYFLKNLQSDVVAITNASGSVVARYSYDAWGVGKGSKGSYNSNPPYIQFEICEDNRQNKAYYEKAFQGAAEYCAYLCEKYGIAVDKIVSHKEAHIKGYGSNHGDPEYWMKNFREDMDGFRKKVTGILKKTPTEAPAEHSTGNTSYLIKVTADVLNIRKGPGINYPKVGRITDKGVYTITEESAGAGGTFWGKLKSGAGWISLDYVRKNIESG